MSGDGLDRSRRSLPRASSAAVQCLFIFVVRLCTDAQRPSEEKVAGIVPACWRIMLAGRSTEQRASAQMIHVRGVISIAAALAMAVSMAGCGGGGSAGSAGLPVKFSQSRFDPAQFGPRVSGANRWLPLKPATQWVRQGSTYVGHRRVPHRVVSTVTDVSRRIAGVSTIAVLDVGIDSGQVAHESIDYFAEDRRGTVWSLGSYANAYEGGRFVSVRDAWLAGVNGGQAGMLMPGDPRLGTPPWFIAKPPGADPDVAQVVSTGQSHCVPLRCFTGVLVIREGKASAPDNEFKYYAAGIGQIDNVPHSASRHKDVEKLINLTMLTPRGLAEASAEALKLDAQARRVRPRVFGHGSAARRTR